MKQFRWNSFGFQIFIWFLLCSFILLLAYSFVSYKRTADQQSKRVSEIAVKNALQSSQYMDLLGSGYDSLSKSITGNFDIQRLIQNEPVEPAEQLINEQAITSILGSVFYSRKDIVGIYVLTEKGKMFSYGSGFQAIDLNYRQSDWYRRYNNAQRGQLIWFGLKPHSMIDQMWSKPVFAFGRQMYDSYLGKSVGVVLIEVKPTAIINMLDNLRIGASGKSFILSSDNEQLAGDDLQSYIDKQSKDILSLIVDKPVSVIDRPDALYIQAKSQNLDWKLLSVAHKEDLNIEVNETRRFLLLIVAVLIIVSIALASMISRRLSSPIKQMVREMKRVEFGNFNGHLEVKSYDEMNFLVASFNRMVIRVNELIERVRIVSLSEKNAQLQALQSQINPHFLYNTLDMIYWMLDDKENEPLGEIIYSLSQMFRYSSDWENSLNVTLQEEIEQVKHFLLILQNRMAGELDVSVDIAENCMHLRLPKMTLQPIIENAVVHGLSGRKGGGCIRIYMEFQGQTARIHIQDNGKGIPQERLLIIHDELKRTVDLHDGYTGFPGKVHEELRGLNGDYSNIGLLNVHRRLTMKFGSSYGLQMESAEGLGTDVIIVIPNQIESNAFSLQN